MQNVTIVLFLVIDKPKKSINLASKFEFIFHELLSKLNMSRISPL